MGSEPEPEPEPTTTTPQLQLTTLPYLKSTQLSGTLTPLTPLHTSASVPFRWEQEPGKPLPCLALVLPASNKNAIKCLDLPPRLLNESKFTKTPSPTTVLEGPYCSLSRSILQSSSFRFLRKRQKSFDGAVSLGGSRGSSPERGLLSTVVVSGDKREHSKGLFRSWRKRGGGVSFKSKSEAHGGSFVFPSFSDDGCTGTGCSDNGGEATVKVARVSSKRSQLGLSHNKSHFWATIYGAFKQAIPRRSTKWKKDEF